MKKKQKMIWHPEIVEKDLSHLETIKFKSVFPNNNNEPNINSLFLCDKCGKYSSLSKTYDNELMTCTHCLVSK